VLLPIDALERVDRTELGGSETPALVDRYPSLSAVRRDATDLHTDATTSALFLCRIGRSCMDAADRVPTATDVIVVGGGIMGTSTAYFLATETDRDVLLLEGDAIASGSTGDSSAILRHHYGPREIYTRMARWSHDFYREFEERVDETIAYAANPLVRFGGEGDSAGEYAKAGFDVLSSLDIPVTRYDGDELDGRFPMIDAGASDFAVSDDTAAYADGTDAAGGFARAARAAGSTVVTGVAVTDIDVRAGSVTAVETDAGTIETDDVVVTAGPWTPRLTATVGVDVPIRRSREQVLVLKPPASFSDASVDIPTTGPPGGDWYVRPDFADGVLVATHHTGEEADPDSYERTPDEDVMLELIDEVTQFVPDLSDAELRGQYCGIYSVTPDHDFVIDRVGPEGCYVGCGFSGHGFKHGPAVGKMLTELLATGDTDLVDAEYFSLDRFKDDPRGHGLPTDDI
jgi:glycine/D-amino acid oxidase-like deaminating enzyme